MNTTESRQALVGALALTGTLFALALVIRYQFWGLGEDPLRSLLRLLGFARGDYWLLLPFLLFAFASYLVRGRCPACYRLCLLIYAIIGFSLILNYVAVENVGQPITVQLLARADFFRSFTPFSAIASVMSIQLGFVLAVAIAALSLLPRIFRKILAPFIDTRFGVASVVAAVSACTAFYLLQPPMTEVTRSKARIENPLTAFVRSVFIGFPIDILDIQSAEKLPNSQFPAITTKPTSRDPNLVVIVLESIGADAAFGPPETKSAGLMPNLANLAGSGVRFSQAYTTNPSSTATGAVVVTGDLSTISVGRDLLDSEGETLATVLGSAGYSTAVFMSGDLDFQDFGPFLRQRGFRQSHDMTADACDTSLEIDDLCTAQAFERWLGRRSGGRFFALIWSGQAHYPYYDADMSGREPASVLARYERSVTYTDRMLGQIVQSLRQHELDGDTLVVILGDHGEAFGEHGFHNHSNSTYATETRIPLIFAGPGIPAGVIDGRPASATDIGTTILSLMGLEKSLGTGQDLFSATTTSNAFSYTASAQPMMSYRFGDTSWILRLSGGVIEQYNLRSDPLEKTPVILEGRKRDEALRIFSRLARHARMRK